MEILECGNKISFTTDGSVANYQNQLKENSGGREKKGKKTNDKIKSGELKSERSAGDFVDSL
jgi:hypothetical protein